MADEEQRSELRFTVGALALLIVFITPFIALMFRTEDCLAVERRWAPEEPSQVTYQANGVPGGIDAWGGIQVGGGVGLKPGHPGYWYTACTAYGPSRWRWEKEK